MVKSPAGYQTGHFPEIRPDTGPDLLSGTPLYSIIIRILFTNIHIYKLALLGLKSYIE